MRSKEDASPIQKPILPVLSRRYALTVAQVFNLPYRRFVIGRTLLARGGWQVKNSLLQLWPFFVPPSALLVSVRDFQDRLFTERFAEQLKADWQLGLRDES